uniref:Uncharacterized protein n=1 Tax=Cacopsylla melanoneura TaxID=428564 RepID=A0A8D9ABN1_9HEMI
MFFSSSFYNPNISHHDMRILQSLALKKRETLQYQQRSYEAQKLWEEDRKSLERKQEEKRKEWKSYVEKKRKRENNMNTMRMEEVKQNLRQAQSLLEARLTERDKRIEEMIQQTEGKKVSIEHDQLVNPIGNLTRVIMLTFLHRIGHAMVNLCQ